MEESALKLSKQSERQKSWHKVTKHTHAWKYIHELRINAIEQARVSEHNLGLWRFSMWPACMLERSRGMGNRECFCISVLIVFMWTKSPLWKWIPWLFSQAVLWFDLWWARLREADLLLHETKLEAAVPLVWGQNKAVPKSNCRNVYSVGIAATDPSYCLPLLLLHFATCWCGHGHSKSG